MYRHALPPGFVLKSQKKAADEAAKANVISLEEFLEVEVRGACFGSRAGDRRVLWGCLPFIAA